MRNEKEKERKDGIEEKSWLGGREMKKEKGRKEGIEERELNRRMRNEEREKKERRYRGKKL